MIYLDHNATTPPAPEVLDAVASAQRTLWGNPSSTHPIGAAARRAVDRARETVAALVGSEPAEVVFTSGGTESDNTALLGVATRAAAEGRGRHLVISAIEHPAVEEPARWLQSQGFAVDRVPPDATGRVPVEAIADRLRPDTILVSLMHANNETGVLQPVREIAALARERGILVHTDAAQTLGKIPVWMEDLGVDLLTIAGHKLHAPKGVGALIVRKGTPIEPFLRGAGHEAGRRAGTENVAGIVGLGTACALAFREGAGRRARMATCRDRLEQALCRMLSGVTVHGAGAERLPNTLSLAIEGVGARDLLEALEGEVAASPGAACHAGEDLPSRVLLAMGISPEVARSTLRLSTGSETTFEEIDVAAGLIGRAASRLRDSQAPACR